MISPKELLASNGDQIILPVDAKVAAEFSNDAAITEVAIDQIPADQEALDVGPKRLNCSTKITRCTYSSLEWTNGCLRIQ